MSIEQKIFGSMPDSTIVNQYILTNASGARLECIEYGARVTGLWMPDKKGTYGNVVLGHDTLEEYFGANYLGSTVGRYANRIAGASFPLGDKTVHAAANENGNMLHGGAEGFHSRVWRMKCCNNGDDAPSITFSLHSPDGDEGFPGNADIEVCYTLSTDNALIIDYRAVCDAPTLMNLTNHSYFNLTGNAKKNILSHELKIDADAYTEVTPDLIPTGRLIPVEGTPFDFRRGKTVGQDINAKDPLLQSCGGYDHNFALNGEGMRRVAEVFDQASGRKMLVFTDLPGIQLYSGNGFPDHFLAHGHIPLKRYCSLCLETQFFPDAPNHANFENPVLLPGEKYTHSTIYKFEIA